MRSFMTLVISSVISLAFIPSKTEAQGGYRQKETLKFFANSEQKTDFLTGFDTEKQQTMRACLKGSKATTTSAGEDAVGTFDHIHTAEEIFEREEMSVEVRASVGYLAAKASLDVRHQMTRSAMSNMEYGAIYGYFEKTQGVRWLNGKKFSLTPWAQKLHDRSVNRADMRPFYKQCGKGAIVGKQYGSFFKGMGTMKFSENATTEEKNLTVKAAIKYSGALVKASAAVDFGKKANKEKKRLNRNTHIEVAWSGDPRIGNPTNLSELAQAYHDFTKSGNRSDLLSIRVAPYEELIVGFGDIGKEAGVGPKRRAKVAKIMNGIAVLQHAKGKLAVSKNGFAPVARRQLGKELQHSLKTFRRNEACLRGAFSRGCENLHGKFASFPKVGRRTVSSLVRTMLDRKKSCGATSWPVVNASGYTTCRRCTTSQVPVFVASKNGTCGYLDDKKASGTVRLRLDDLGKLVEVSPEAGVKTKRRNRPDVCARRGKKCLQKRATAICEARGFAKALDFGTMRHSPTFYTNGKRCVQKAEERMPAPQTCRTFRFIDCGCPKGKRPKGKQCVSA